MVRLSLAAGCGCLACDSCCILRSVNCCSPYDQQAVDVVLTGAALSAHGRAALSAQSAAALSAQGRAAVSAASVSVWREDCTGDAPLTGCARPGVRSAVSACFCAGWEGAAKCHSGAGEGRLCGAVSAETWACFGLCCCERLQPPEPGGPKPPEAGAGGASQSCSPGKPRYRYPVPRLPSHPSPPSPSPGGPHTFVNLMHVIHK